MFWHRQHYEFTHMVVQISYRISSGIRSEINCIWQPKTHSICLHNTKERKTFAVSPDLIWMNGRHPSQQSGIPVALSLASCCSHGPSLPTQFLFFFSGPISRLVARNFLSTFLWLSCPLTWFGCWLLWAWSSSFSKAVGRYPVHENAKINTIRIFCRKLVFSPSELCAMQSSVDARSHHYLGVLWEDGWSRGIWVWEQHKDKKSCIFHSQRPITAVYSGVEMLLCHS